MTDAQTVDLALDGLAEKVRWLENNGFSRHDSGCTPVWRMVLDEKRDEAIQVHLVDGIWLCQYLCDNRILVDTDNAFSPKDAIEKLNALAVRLKEQYDRAVQIFDEMGRKLKENNHAE